MSEIHTLPWPYARKGRQIAIPKKTIGWIALMVTIISASTYNGFAKDLGTVFSPLALLFVSESLTLLFVLISFGLVPTLRHFFHLRRKHYFPLLIVSLCSGVAAPLLVFAGLERTSAVNASFFGNSEMLFLFIFSGIVLHEKWTRQHVLASFMIVAGILTIVLKGFTDGFTQLQTGDFLILSAGMAFSIGSITFRRFLHHLEPQLVMCARSSTAVLLIFLVSPFIEHPFIHEVRSFPIALLPALIGFGFLSRFLNVFSFYEALDHLPVSTVSLALSVQVIGSVLFASVYLQEGILWYHFLGGILIILGSVLLELLGIHPTPMHLEKHLRMRHRHA